MKTKSRQFQTRQSTYRLGAALVSAVLCMLETGCAVLYPPIDSVGTNCEAYYGVSERQNTPMNCPIGEDGLPLVETVSFSEVRERCIGDAPVSKNVYVWGCVAPNEDRSRYQAYAVGQSPGVYRHEQCHCLLGPVHPARYRPIEFGSPNRLEGTERRQFERKIQRMAYFESVTNIPAER